jgi:cellulose synthase/poly-beta-1,6-N-acetylglucosamine synthase-like glycosyltransferase
MFAVLNVALVIFTSAYTIYLLWQIVAWAKRSIYKPSTKEFKTKVTVIVPCRNEEKNITNCLESILKQSYPSSLLEVIVADDNSEDNTAKISKGYLEKSTCNWKYVLVNTPSSNKKTAIAAAIKESTGELIVITDADCTSHQNWISSIVSLYKEKNYQMICGPVSIISGNNSCGKFQSLEFTGLSVLAGAGIFSRLPLLSNGANIAYTKEAFIKVGGFSGNENKASGDDTLLLFKINQQYPGKIGFIKSPEAIVSTTAQPTWSSFMQQRIRWASKSFKSNNSLNSLVSLLVFVTNFLLLVSGIGSLVYFSFNLTIICCLIVKFTVDFLLLTCGTNFFKKQYMLFYFPLGELITMCYVSWVGLVANFSGYHWKGRDY